MYLYSSCLFFSISSFETNKLSVKVFCGVKHIIHQDQVLLCCVAHQYVGKETSLSLHCIALIINLIMCKARVLHILCRNTKATQCNRFNVIFIFMTDPVETFDDEWRQMDNNKELAQSHTIQNSFPLAGKSSL